MKINTLILIIFLPFCLWAQGGLIIGNSTKMVFSGSPDLIIKDGKFHNDGDLIPDEGTVYLIGNNTTENSTIGGSATSNFYLLNLNKTNHNVRLDANIHISGDLVMQGGKLLLNQNDISLGGHIIGETSTNSITGTTGGSIYKTLTLTAPVNQNPGNLGAEITSPADLGETRITRRHVQLENNGNTGIFRHYLIEPTNNNNLDATLRFHYFDEELDGLEESLLEVWQNENANWVSLSATDNSTLNNWVETTDISTFSLVTLAEDLLGPLPIELLRFDVVLNEQKEVALFWSTVTEADNDYFTIERSKDGIQFEPIENIPGAGNSDQILHYQTLDRNPYSGTSYYRLRQTDFNGTYTFSEIRAVNIESYQSFSVYPNPLKEVLHIDSDATVDGKTTIEIVDVLGRIVYTKNMEMDELSHSITIEEVSAFEAGNYFLTIRTKNQNYNFNLVKVRQ